jgi:hypothetical protein
VAAYIRQRPASWFWLVGQMVTFWGVAGCAAWVAARTGIAFAAEAAPPGLPLAFAAGAVLGGGIALLNKKRFAQLLFVVALIAAAAQIVWLVTERDLLLGQGVLAGMTLLIAVLLVWFAEHSRRHGWIS